MEDKKDTSTTELKLEKKNGKVKKEWTVKRVLTTVIIGILALLMVGGSFYYIFTPGFSRNSNAFGFYEKEPVLYENNNVFYRTLMADENYMNALSTGDYSTIYTSWYRAYQSQVAYIALSKMADKAGVLAPQELVEKTIIASGAFNNEEGEFDAELFNSLSDSEKRVYYNYIKSVTPFQTVVNDVYSALTSAQERAFIKEVGSDARTFEYFVVGSNVYPDEEAKKYVADHKDYFKFVDVSMISCATEEQAKACYDELQAGLAWADAVAKYSGDAYAANEGRVGASVFAGIFKTNVNDPTAITQIANLKALEYTQPIEGPYSFAIYRLNSPAVDVDVEDADMLKQAKQLIYADDKSVMQNYIDDAVSKASVGAKYDFETAAEFYGDGLISVGPAVNNSGSSSVLYGIENYDSTGYLYQAVSENEDLYKDLYSNAVGYVAGPIEVEDGYLFVHLTASSEEESLGDLTQALYTYYCGQFDVTDFQNSVLTSDKHEDNFTVKFVDMFFGDAASLN